MIATRADGYHFHLSWPPWQPPGVNGLAAIVTPTASTSWADSLLARDQDRLVVWAASGNEPERQALSRLRQPGVRAVSLVPARSDPRWVQVAIELALRLSAARCDDHPAEPCVTSRRRPNPPPGAVRIPHLLTVRREGEFTDAVVWELAPLTVARRWLGGAVPDFAFFERHLDALLRLRRAARRGQLPVRVASAGLAELLGEHELSIQLVYEHAGRFRTLLNGSAPDGSAPDYQS